MVKLRDLKKGDLFTLRPGDNATLYVKGEYERSLKKFSVHKYEDVNDERFIKGDKLVIVD